MCANTGDVAKAISDLQTLMDAHLGEALRKALWEAGPAVKSGSTRFTTSWCSM
jgi:hypothetical protein